MASLWLYLLVIAGISINALSLLSVVERLMRLKQPNARRKASATLILPITGVSPGLEQLVANLAAQSLRPRRLLIAVESSEDPAHRRALDIAASAAIPLEVVVAGQATHQAQKCRNQQAALARIDGRDDAIVLLDSDIRPHPDWLSNLVSPLVGGHYDIVTGHRWQSIDEHRLGAHLVTAIDRGVTLLPRLGSASGATVWGGSVAMSPASAAMMDLAGCLENTLSDDLTIADRAASAGLRLLTRGGLLVDSPTALDLAGAWRFTVRQYRIGHIYRPWLWLMGVLAVNLRLVAWIVAISLFLTGSGLGWAVASLAGLAVAKQYLVAEMARRLDMPDPPSVRAVQLALGLLQPLVDMFHAGALIAAISTRYVKWGHLTYEIEGPYAVKVRERQPFSVS